MNDLPPDHNQRLRRAKATIEGLSLGDSFGSFFEMSVGETPWHIRKYRLPPEPWRWTDDTLMAMSIFDNLRQYGEVNQDELAQSFAKYFDPSRGYGAGATQLLMGIQQGKDWRDLSPNMFNKSGSYGNGAAMRVAPLGAYFAESPIEQVIEQAKLSAEITHSHPEGIAGAITMAVATVVAWQFYVEGREPDRKHFINRIVPHIPDGETRDRVIEARDIQREHKIENIAHVLGNGSNVSAMDTLPLVLYCAGEFMDNFEQAMWKTARALGDTDTNCAMVGAIITTYQGIQGVPKGWKFKREPLPLWYIEESQED